MFLFGTKSFLKHHLIFDIGSSRANLAVVELRSDGKIDPHKLAKAGVRRLFRSENIILPATDLRRLWRKVSGLALKVVSDYKESGIRADKALVAFSSPWYYSEIRSISKKISSSQLITKEYLGQLITAEEKEFKKDMSSNFGVSEDDLAHIQSFFMSAKLNGYPVLNPIQNIPGKSAEDVFVSAYLSAFFSDAALYVKKLLADHGVNDVEFQSSEHIIFSVLSSDGLTDVSIVNIGEEITDIILVDGGYIRKTASFGRGLNYIIRRIAGTLHLGLEESADTILNYKENKLESRLAESVSKALADSIKEWHSLFKETIEKHISPVLMPEDIVIIGHTGLSEFGESIGGSVLNNYTAHGGSFSVSELSGQNLMDFYLRYISNESR